MRSPGSAQYSACGFTLLETAVVLVVIGVVAAVLTPLLSGVLEDARVTRAEVEVETLARAIRNFSNHTGHWPIFGSGSVVTTSSAIYTVLVGPGADPAPAGSPWLPAPGERGGIDEILGRNLPGYSTTGKFRWRGPYLDTLGTDPWGHTYIVNAASLGFGVREAGFVLSAGPNGTIETAFQQATTTGSPEVVRGGDDIVARIK